MQKLFQSLGVGILALCFGVSGVFGWDDVGHKVTGYIAWQRLSPTARDNVIRILRAAPEDSQLGTFFMAYGPRSEDQKRLDFFTFVPTWADVVRDRAFPVRFEKYHRSNWHYSDTFWREVNGRPETITDKVPGGQGVAKLIEFDEALRKPAATDSEKAIAIAWLLHIGGDLHQPLHTSGRHTDREPTGDLGGNLFLLTPEGTKREEQVNLHWFWDSIVTRNVPYLPSQCEDDYIRVVAESMMAKYPFDSLKPALKLKEYESWQKESFALAPTEVFRSDLVRFSTPTDQYRRNAFSVAEQRLAVAGYRLGETLNGMFAN